MVTRPSLDPNLTLSPCFTHIFFILYFHSIRIFCKNLKKIVWESLGIIRKMYMKFVLYLGKNSLLKIRLIAHNYLHKFRYQTFSGGACQETTLEPAGLRDLRLQRRAAPSSPLRNQLQKVWDLFIDFGHGPWHKNDTLHTALSTQVGKILISYHGSLTSLN